MGCDDYATSGTFTRSRSFLVQCRMYMRGPNFFVDIARTPQKGQRAIPYPQRSNTRLL